MEKIAIKADKVVKLVQDFNQKYEQIQSNLDNIDMWDLLDLRKDINEFLQAYRKENKHMNQGKHFSQDIEDKMTSFSQDLLKEFHTKFVKTRSQKTDSETIKKMKQFGLKNEEIQDITGVGERNVKRMNVTDKKVEVGGQGEHNFPWYEGLEEPIKKPLIEAYYKRLDTFPNEDDAKLYVQKKLESFDQKFTDTLNNLYQKNIEYNKAKYTDKPLPEKKQWFHEDENDEKQEKPKAIPVPVEDLDNTQFPKRYLIKTMNNIFLEFIRRDNVKTKDTGELLDDVNYPPKTKDEKGNKVPAFTPKQLENKNFDDTLALEQAPAKDDVANEVINKLEPKQLTDQQMDNEYLVKKLQRQKKSEFLDLDHWLDQILEDRIFQSLQ